jgi:hypothetical protein
MARKKTVMAAGVLVIWMFIVAVCMILARTVNMEIFFVLWLIGALIVIEFTDLTTILPRWSIYQKGLGIAGICAFGMIILIKILEILAE